MGMAQGWIDCDKQYKVIIAYSESLKGEIDGIKHPVMVKMSEFFILRFNKIRTVSFHVSLRAVLSSSVN